MPIPTHPICELFIRNLSPHTTQQHLQTIFSRFGPTTKCLLIKQKPPHRHRSKEFAYITFRHLQDAQQCQTALHGTLLHNRFIIVSYALVFTDKRQVLFSFLDESTQQPQMQLDDVSLYSVSDATNADSTSHIIQQLMTYPEELHSRLCTKSASELIITDANSCIGGNSISFLRHFGRVNVCELDKQRYAMLQHNIRVCGLQSKVGQSYNGSYLDVLEKWGAKLTPTQSELQQTTNHSKSETSADATLYQDVVFSDPPWGGTASPA